MRADGRGRFYPHARRGDGGVTGRRESRARTSRIPRVTSLLSSARGPRVGEERVTGWAAACWLLGLAHLALSFFFVLSSFSFPFSLLNSFVYIFCLVYQKNMKQKPKFIIFHLLSIHIIFVMFPLV